MKASLQIICEIVKLSRLLDTRLKTMPVNGLPRALEMMLTPLVQDNTLVTWQIFSEKDVCVKLRFNGGEKDSSSVSYKKKAPSQLNRDRARAIDHRSKLKQNQPRNESCDRITRSRAKDMMTADVEVNRSCPSELNPMCEPFIYVTPVYHRQRPDSSLIQPTPTPHTPDQSRQFPYDGDVSDRRLEASCPNLDTSLESVSTGLETDTEDQLPGVGARCDHPDCIYGGYDGTVPIIKRHFKCRKCNSSIAGTFTLCNYCYNLGTHHRHRTYLEVIEDTD